MSSLGPRRNQRLTWSLERIAANDPTHTDVNFNELGIGDKGTRRLVVALQGNTHVRSLRLEMNGISAALVPLVGVLESVASLKILDLDGNSCGSESALALAQLLQSISSITHLFLRDCGIGVEGVGVLAGALPTNSSLLHLGLGGNEIGDVGASALARVLPAASTLTSIDLSGNEISDAGAMALTEALPHHSSLEVLNLWANDISDVGARLLAKALLVNSSVTALYLVGNTISVVLEHLVEELSQINNGASSPQEALGRKIEWLQNLDEGGLRLLGFEESGVEDEILRLETVCSVVWLISSGVDGEKEQAVALVLDQLEHFMQADQRRGLFGQLLGSPKLGVEVASSVDETTARTLYHYAVQCGSAPGVLMNLVRAHGSLCTCRDVKHHLFPFILLATMPEAGVGDVMELLLINPSLVESGISGPNEYKRISLAL